MAAGNPEADEAAGWDGGMRPDVSSTLPTRPPPPRSTTPPTNSLREEQTAIERRHSTARLQAALEAGTRTDATLSGLLRAIQHLTDGVSGAREANETLMAELEGLRTMLGVANEQHLSYKHKVTLLEQAMERARQNAEQEKNYLITQHDAFITELIEDHEAELDTLRTQFASGGPREPIDLERLSSIPPPITVGARPLHAQATQAAQAPAAEVAELERHAKKLREEQHAAREALLRLQAQRDEAQATVVKLTRERDDAHAQVARLQTELGGPRVSLSPQPPPAAESRRSSGSSPYTSAAPPVASAAPAPVPAALRPTPRPPAHTLKLDQVEMDAALSRPPAVAPAPLTKPAEPPPANAEIPRLTPPPAELRAALTGVHFPPLEIEPARSPLKQKPDPSTRPLIGYSLGAGSIRPERIEGVALSSKPPSGASKPPSGAKK
jgi:predicted  nucleic acid-binding Zn-ribbon protein